MKFYYFILLSLLFYITGCSQNKIFDQASAIYINVGPSPPKTEIADLNKDGLLDIACANYESNGVTILLVNKSSIFNLHTQNIAVGSAPYGVAAGDLNGDNKPDIVTANFESNNITILFNSAE